MSGPQVPFSVLPLPLVLYPLCPLWDRRVPVLPYCAARGGRAEKGALHWSFPPSLGGGGVFPLFPMSAASIVELEWFGLGFGFNGVCCVCVLFILRQRLKQPYPSCIAKMSLNCCCLHLSSGDHRHVPPCPVYEGPEVEPRALCTLGKHFTN